MAISNPFLLLLVKVSCCRNEYDSFLKIQSFTNRHCLALAVLSCRNEPFPDARIKENLNSNGLWSYSKATQRNSEDSQIMKNHWKFLESNLFFSHKLYFLDSLSISPFRNRRGQTAIVWITVKSFRARRRIVWVRGESFWRASEQISLREISLINLLDPGYCCLLGNFTLKNVSNIKSGFPSQLWLNTVNWQWYKSNGMRFTNGLLVSAYLCNTNKSRPFHGQADLTMLNMKKETSLYCFHIFQILWRIVGLVVKIIQRWKLIDSTPWRPLPLLWGATLVTLAKALFVCGLH